MRLPNERPPIWPRIRGIVGAIFTMTILGAIGVGVYFGVTLLLDEDEPAASEVVQEESSETTAADPVAASAQQSGVGEAASSEATASEAQDVSTAEGAQGDAGETTAVASQTEEPAQAAEDVVEADETAHENEPEQTTSASGAAEPAETAPLSVSVSSIEPIVSENVVTAAQIDGAEVVAERVTGEPIPSGIPRELADGAAYDPTEPATVFTSRWPVGTTLRLIRLPGATLLSDEQQAEVVGSEALVVVRGTEASNTDLQLSPATFDRIAFYGTERIIAVRVEVTAPPP